MNLEVVLIQADALHTQKHFFAAPGARGQFSHDGESEPTEPAPPDQRPVPLLPQNPFQATVMGTTPPGRWGPNRHRSTFARPGQAAAGSSNWTSAARVTARTPSSGPFFSRAYPPRPKLCCNWRWTAGARKAGTGCAAPNIMSMVTAMAAPCSSAGYAAPSNPERARAARPPIGESWSGRRAVTPRYRQAARHRRDQTGLGGVRRRLICLGDQVASGGALNEIAQLGGATMAEGHELSSGCW